MRKLPRLVLLSLLLSACSGSPSPGAKAPSPDSQPSPAAEAPKATLAEAPTAPAAPPEDSAAARKKRVDEALARVPKLIEGLAALRELPFKTAVPSEYQDTAAFRAFVKSETAAELGGDKAKALSAAYFHMGLLKADVDLLQMLEDTMVSQAAAYYDPKQDKFFVVMVPSSDFAFDMIVVHELTHALADQHFDLDAYLTPKGKKLSTDAVNARRFVVEGEATLTMMVNAMPGKSAALAKDRLPSVKMALGQMAALSLDDFKKMTKQQAMGAVGFDSDIQKSIDAMDTIPPVILVPLMDSYMKGSLVALAAYAAGGWAEVSKLYQSPPDSTEQALHPDTKLYPTRDLPRAITLPKLKGLTESHQDTMGELEWRIYFSMWLKDGAEAAAAGWDGDRWAVYKAADGTSVGVSVSVWDSEAEAKEFADAYRASFAARFPGGERKSWVNVKGDKVYIVDGGKDDKLVAQLEKGAKIAK